MIFNLPEVDKKQVFWGIDCYENSPVFSAVSKKYDEVYDEAKKLILPEAWVEFEGNVCYVLMSIGAAVSEYSTSLFLQGEGVGGLIVNQIADESLFSLDYAVSQYIKVECARRGLGVKTRSEDLDFELILSKCKGTNVCLTDAKMLSPSKSMGFVLELTDDQSVFNAQHNCSKCKCTTCPRRSTPYKDKDLTVLSDYDSLKINPYCNAVCIDIGTTTIAISFIKNGNTKSIVTFPNPQRRFGADVLSRIEAAARGRLAEMKQALAYKLTEAVRFLTGGDTKQIIISANTTMVYLLMGYDPRELGAYPFNVSHKETLKCDFKDITGTNINVPTVIVPPVSAFVGGDIVSGIYMTDMHKSNKNNLLLDLGTNGEMVIGNKERLFCSSAAAGPAFEGGTLSCGCASVEGAICAVGDDGSVSTIGGKEPVGVCGSGIVELLAFMIKNKIIDNTGKLDDKYIKNGYPIYGDLYFTQQDIREIQTAKSAVCAGILTLIERSGISDVENVYLAGGFGHAINKDAAVEIGLIPQRFINKIHAVGNSSLGGAVKLASENGFDELEHICEISTEIVLGNDEFFVEKFIANMNFDLVQSR